MAIGGTIRLEGDKELLKNLQSLKKNVSTKIVRGALRMAAKGIQWTAKQNAPVDTGLLRTAIKVRATKKRKKDVIGINVITGEGDYKGRTFYGSFIEYGHRRGKRTASIKRAQKLGHSPFDNRPWVAPKPYLRPAFEAEKGPAVRTIQREIGRGVRDMLYLRSVRLQMDREAT